MRYHIELSALAVVRQVQYLDAASEDEAKQAALEQVSEHIWHYEELSESEPIHVLSVSVARR